MVRELCQNGWVTRPEQLEKVARMIGEQGQDGWKTRPEWLVLNQKCVNPINPLKNNDLCGKVSVTCDTSLPLPSSMYQAGEKGRKSLHKGGKDVSQRDLRRFYCFPQGKAVNKRAL